VNIANKSLIIQGLGVQVSDVKIVLIGGSLKLAPSENDTIVVRGISVEALTTNPAIEVYWSGKKGVNFDIGVVKLENLIINATQAIATSIQVGPHVKFKAFELRNSEIYAGEIGVQVGPDTVASGAVIITNNTIQAGKVGVQIGPSTQVADYLEISRNTIEAGIVGIRIGSPTGPDQAPPSLDRLVIVRNIIASNSSNVLEIKSVIRNYAHVYLNIFIGDGSSVSLNIDTNLVPLDKILFNTPYKLTYFYNGKIYTNYLGNYYVDWTMPDNDADGIVDEPRIITQIHKDSYPLADSSILYYIEQPWPSEPSEEIYIAMGGGVLLDTLIESYVLLVFGALLFVVTRRFSS